MEALAPLFEHCKAGRLFEVQEWIHQGHPINLPTPPKINSKARTPLEVAIERGFYSLVQVLLEGGAVQEPEGYYSPMNKALRARRMDMVELLVKMGFDPTTVEMNMVFETWDPKIMSFFINRGADIRKGNPFAAAFCNNIRTALGPFRSCRERRPDMVEQANIALRHHCKEGNLKWIALMLWAGADPYKPGVLDPQERMSNDDDGFSALDYAAMNNHFEVFDMKAIRAKEDLSKLAGSILHLMEQQGLVLLRRVLESGINPNDSPKGGCSAFRHAITLMALPGLVMMHSRSGLDETRKIDNHETKNLLKAIHLLAKHGAKWIPEDRTDITYVRRDLLCLAPEYTLEFVWIMAKYKACCKDCTERLLNNPKMNNHMSKHLADVRKLLSSWDE